MTGRLNPAVSVREDEQEYVVYMLLPGFSRKDILVTISNSHLKISAAKKEAFHYLLEEENGFPEFEETYRLPEDADTLMTAAVYRNGELEIHIPRGRSTMKQKKPVELFVY